MSAGIVITIAIPGGIVTLAVVCVAHKRWRNSRHSSWRAIQNTIHKVSDAHAFDQILAVL